MYVYQRHAHVQKRSGLWLDCTSHLDAVVPRVTCMWLKTHYTTMLNTATFWFMKFRKYIHGILTSKWKLLQPYETNLQLQGWALWAILLWNFFKKRRKNLITPISSRNDKETSESSTLKHVHMHAVQFLDLWNTALSKRIRFLAPLGKREKKGEKL